jgi:endonuclease III
MATSPKHVEKIAATLKRRYRDHAHFNKRNPLDELLFIICSTQTTETSYRRTFRDLRREFPTFGHLAEAPAEYLEKPLAPGGLSNQKAKAMRQIFDAIEEKFGRLTLSPLREHEDHEAEAFLTSLPGVGKKVARCVMMYSLDRDVFPVDTHCWRITRRLGWVRPTTSDGHCSERDMDRLQDKIPPHLRFTLHVSFVSFGREVCTATRPKCGKCPLARQCKKIGVYSFKY